MYSYAAKWVRVVDGDTLILTVDLGFLTSHTGSFRMLGFNAPEIYGPSKVQGLAAKEALERILLNAGPDLRIESHKSDKYGRWLAVLFYKDAAGTEININEVMAAMNFEK